MKKLILAMVAVAAVSTACAQSTDRQQPPKQMTADERTEQMVSKLGLDDAQAAQLKELNANYQDIFQGPGGGEQPPKMDGNNGNGKPSGPPQMTDEQKQQMQQHKAKRTEYETKLKAILTDDQYSTYHKMQPQRGDRKGGGPRNK